MLLFAHFVYTISTSTAKSCDTFRKLLENRVEYEFEMNLIPFQRGGGGKGAKSRVCHKVYIFISLHTHACYLAVYLSVCEGVCV